MSPDSSRLKQLDGLRCYAVILVIWFHWAEPPYKGYIFKSSIGEIGVTLFFVLSGFLITTILINARQDCQHRNDTSTALKSFFIRRSLRIFPLYYTSLLTLVLLDIKPHREALLWHATYLQNLYQKITTAEIIGSHFWTLAIEEQFYIFWPFLLFWINQRFFPHLFAAIIAMSVIYRFSWQFFSSSLPSPSLLLIDYLDCFGIGAVSSYYSIRFSRMTLDRIITILFIAGSSLFYLSQLQSSPLQAFQQPSVALFCAGLVLLASRGPNGLTGRLLGNSVATYIGTISYGLYVFHGLTPAYWQWFFWSCPIPGYRLFSRFGIPVEMANHFWFNIFIYILVTSVLSVISWHLLEKPLASLKHRFPYSRKSSQLSKT